MERADVQRPTEEDWRTVLPQLPRAICDVAICVGGQDLADAVRERPVDEELNIGAIELIDARYPGSAHDIMRRAKQIELKQQLHEARVARLVQAGRIVRGLVEEVPMLRLMRPLRRKT